MRYKLVAIDCDNTLLNSTGHIPNENKETIQYLKEKGVEFIIATGRNDILVWDYIKELDIKAPVIGCNGASIRDLASNKLYSFSPISKQALRDIFGYCDKNGIPFKAFTMEKGFANSHEAVEQGLKQILSSYTKALAENIPYEYTNDTEYLTENEKIIKVVIVDNNISLIEKYRSELKPANGIEICRSTKNCLDICANEVSKGNALKKYADMLGINQSEIVAFGDSENDFSMLNYAGFSVAMENGEEELKNYADMVTVSNDNAGVSKALKKIFACLY